MTYADSFSSVGSESDAADAEPLLSVRRLGQAALVLIVGLMVARATMVELVRDPFQPAPGQIYAPLGTGPGVTVVLNLVCMLPALMLLVRRAVTGEHRFARAWGPLLWVALGLLATASFLWTSDRFSTLVTGSTLLAAGAVCWATAQAVRSWGRFRLVTAVLSGLLLVYCAQGLFYHYVELPELKATVEKTKDQVLRERGFEPGTFQAEQFLRRISSGEMVGFGVSPNTYGAVLVFLGVISAGLLFQGVASRRDPVLMALLAASLVAAVWVGSYTRSTTAVATPVLAGGIIAGAWALRRHAAGHRRALFLAGVAVVVLAVAAVVAHGVHRGTLPGASLNFRWRYWVGAYAVFQQHPLLGVGFSAFGENYLAHRVPAAAEEVRDPHNFLVRFATELGGAGLLLCVLWLARSWWEATRPIAPAGGAAGVPAARGLPVGIVTLTLACVLGSAINVASSVDFASGSDYIVVEMFKRLMFLGALIVGAGLATISTRTSATLDDSPAPWALWATAAACAVFLVHNLIDFSLFEPGPMTMFAVALGSVIGVRARVEPATGAGPDPAARPLPRLAAGAAAVMLVAAGVAFARAAISPVQTAEARARAADELIRTARTKEGDLDPGRLELAAQTYLSAHAAVPFNHDYPYRAARAQMMAQRDLATIRRLLDLAAAIDPKDIRSRLDRARLELALPVNPQTNPDLALAVRLFEEATRLNPTDLPIRTEYADALERVGRPAEAREQLETVLRYNDLLDPTEPKRLTPGQIAALRARVAALAPTARP